MDRASAGRCNTSARGIACFGCDADARVASGTGVGRDGGANAGIGTDCCASARCNANRCATGTRNGTG